MTDRDPSAVLGLTVAKAAERLGCSTKKIRKLIDADYLDVYPGPGVMTITMASWERYLDSAGSRQPA